MLLATARTYKQAYSGLSRSTWLLSLVMLINRSGTMVIPFMTLYLTEKMGYSVGEAGIVFGLFGAGAFTGAFFGGKITDKIGFYPVQLITLIGGGIMFMVLGQMNTYTSISIFTFLLSFVNEAFRPANSTAIAFYSKVENRTRSYALNRLAINLGWAVGSGLGGFIAHYDYELLFWVDGATNLFAALLLWIFLKPARTVPGESKTEPGLPVLSAYKDRTYLFFIVLTMFFASCFFQLFTNLPVYFKKDLKFSEPFIGILMATNGLIIAFLEMVLVYKLERKGHILRYIAFGILLVGISFITLNIPGIGHVLAFAMIAIVTFGEIFAMPFMNTYWISRTHHSNRGEYAALYTMAWSAAQTMGPLLGAQLADSSGFKWLWWSTGIICLGVSVSFWRMYRKNSRFNVTTAR